MARLTTTRRVGSLPSADLRTRIYFRHLEPSRLEREAATFYDKVPLIRSANQDVALAMVRTQSSLQVSDLRTPRMAAHIVKFTSREEQLRLRGVRNFCRWMAKVRNRVEHDSPQWWKWKDDAFAERKADAEWAKRHGPIRGGAWVARFPPAGGQRERANRRRSSRRARRG